MLCSWCIFDHVVSSGVKFCWIQTHNSIINNVSIHGRYTRLPHSVFSEGLLINLVLQKSCRLSEVNNPWCVDIAGVHFPFHPLHLNDGFFPHWPIKINCFKTQALWVMPWAKNLQYLVPIVWKIRKIFYINMWGKSQVSWACWRWKHQGSRSDIWPMYHQVMYHEV